MKSKTHVSVSRKDNDTQTTFHIFHASWHNISTVLY